MSLKYNCFLLSASIPLMAVTFLSHAPANAGFEWTPPEETSSPVTSIDEEGSIKAPEALMEVVEEVIIEETATNEADLVLTPVSNEDVLEIIEVEVMEEEEPIIEEPSITAPSEVTPLAINPFPEQNEIETTDNIIVLTSESDEDISGVPLELEEKITWNEVETFDVIEGFGTDMPLALALRQIVPVKYAFSFGKSVNPGEVVSWKGGKPWNIVLEDALAPLNIAYDIIDNKLKLSKIATEESDVPAIQEPVAIIEDIIIEEKPIEILEESVTPPTIEINSEASIKRKPILEPEPFETEQHVTSEILKEANLLEEKKNEVETVEKKVETEVSPELVDISSSIVSSNEQLDDIALPPPEDVIEWNVIEVETEINAPLPLKSDVVVDDVDNITMTEEVVVIKQNNNYIDISPPVKENINWAIGETDITEENPVTDEQIIEQIPVAANDIDEEATRENIEEIEIEVIKAIKIDGVEVITPTEEKVEIISLRTEPSNNIKIWEAKRGFDLKEVLTKWSDEEEVKFSWYLSNNYKISKDVFISGTFKNALDILFAKGVKSAPQYSLTEVPSYELSVGKVE